MPQINKRHPPKPPSLRPQLVNTKQLCSLSLPPTTRHSIHQGLKGDQSTDVHPFIKTMTAGLLCTTSNATKSAWAPSLPAELTEVHVSIVICQGSCLHVETCSVCTSGRTNEWKVRERTHCGKRFLPVFTPVRRENWNKRRMEVRIKRRRHERHILREFIKGGRRQWLLLFFYPFGNCP